MKTRRAHRLLGLVMLAPLFGWAATGFLFFIKPGWDAAYGSLSVRTYPLGAAAVVATDPEWLEARRMRTILGEHLLVRSGDGWSQREPSTGRVRVLPDESDLRRLIEDAISSNRERYGEIADVTRGTDGASVSARTTTGVAIDLDWNRLQLSQSGADTRRINALYRVHYLQWTGIRTLDRALGITGLLLLVTLALFGALLAFGRRA